jgi:hypothetical protein
MTCMIFLTSYILGVQITCFRGNILRAPTLHKSGEYQALCAMPWDFVYLKIGVWRSLVARTPGGREVIGSNPVTPTKQ